MPSVRVREEINSVLTILEARSKREIEELKSREFKSRDEVTRAAAEYMLDVGRETGLLLNIMIRNLGAKKILEVGASVGYSTIWMAEAARATGGRVYSFEFEPAKAEDLAINLARAGLRDHVEIIAEDCSKVIPNLEGPFDLVLLDHWKEHYIREFDSCWPKLRSGGLVLADNINHSPMWSAGFTNKGTMEKYVNHVRALPDARSLTLDIGSGIEITCKETEASLA